MAVELLMPALSPTMKEGTLAKWNKKEGDRVKIGEIIAEIETDKAVMEFEAIDEGVIGRILIPERTENVAVNALIAVLLEEGEDLTVIDQILSSRGKASGASVKESSKNEVEKHTQVSDKKEHNDKVEKIFISPLAKRLAEQNAIDINSINGSGPRGRIVKSDIESAMERVPQGGPLKAAIVDTIMYGRNSEEYTKVPNNNRSRM
jgi:pyruvate dehydrogenase E2 component (dihydrolipoamide acetyltransferase)